MLDWSQAWKRVPEDPKPSWESPSPVLCSSYNAQVSQLKRPFHYYLHRYEHIERVSQESICNHNIMVTQCTALYEMNYLD